MERLGFYWISDVTAGLACKNGFIATSASSSLQLRSHIQSWSWGSWSVRDIILLCWGNCSPYVTPFILTGNNLRLLRISNVSHLNFIVKYILHRNGVRWLVNASQRILLSLTSKTLKWVEIYLKWKVQIVQISSLIRNRAGYFPVDTNVLLQVKLSLS